MKTTRKSKTNIILIFCLIIIATLTSCARKGIKEYTIGETQEFVYSESKVKLESADYEYIEDTNECLLELEYIIYPDEKEVELEYEDISVAYDYSESFYSKKDKNIEKNSYDIFETSIKDETKYTFYFIIPYSPYFDDLDNRSKGYEGRGIKCEVYDVYFYIYTGKLYDNKQQVI